MVPVASDCAAEQAAEAGSEGDSSLLNNPDAPGDPCPGAHSQDIDVLFYSSCIISRLGTLGNIGPGHGCHRAIIEEFCLAI